MSRLFAFKVEVTCDDAVRAEAVKAKLQSTLRDLGTVHMTPDPEEGQPPLSGDCAAFFGATGVKTFVTREPKQKTPRTKP